MSQGIATMACSSGGSRKKRPVSSLDGEVLERLSMKLNPRMLMKDYKMLAGRLKYTYEYIQNFAREHDPTLALLHHWWSSKRGKEKTVSVLIEHLSDMERDDAVDLLRPYEYYSSHEAAEYDESFDKPVITINADIPRNVGRENEPRQNASDLGACKPDVPGFSGHPGPWEYKQNQRASFNGSFQPHSNSPGFLGHPGHQEYEQNQRTSFNGNSQFYSTGAFQSPVSPIPSSPPGDMSRDRDRVSSPYAPPFDADERYHGGFPGARRDITLQGPPRPHTLDGSSASSVDGEYYSSPGSPPSGMYGHERMTRNYGADVGSRYSPGMHGQYRGLSAAEGHTLTAAADKVALVIGNQDYAHRKLKGLQYPEQDAADVAAALTNLGFKVVSLVNLTLVEMRTAMLAFCCLLGKGVYGVVYYAGHGYEDSGENYLLPVDSDLKYNREHSLRTQEILEAMQQCETSLNLLIVDACRVSVPNRSGITVPRIKKSARGNNIFAYSCCSQQEALEEPNCRNGMYCSHLLRRLSENRRVENILMDVGTDFAREYNLPQRPCLETDCVMDFRLTDPIQPEFLPQEYIERLRRWNEAKRFPREFSTEDHALRFSFNFEAPFSNVLRVMVTTAKKNERPVTEFFLALLPTDPLRCLDGSVFEFDSGDKLSVQTFDVINIQKLYKSQGSLILSLQVMYKVDGKLCRFEKDLDLGWPLVSSVMCLWDHWLLGDRCKTTAV